MKADCFVGCRTRLGGDWHSGEVVGPGGVQTIRNPSQADLTPSPGYGTMSHKSGLYSDLLIGRGETERLLGRRGVADGASCGSYRGSGPSYGQSCLWC
jgi:hypothetical protein